MPETIERMTDTKAVRALCQEMLTGFAGDARVAWADATIFLLCDELDALRKPVKGRPTVTLEQSEILAGDFRPLLDYIRALEAEVNRLKAERAEAFEVLTQSELGCNHHAGDGSDDCGNIDDCMYHALAALLEPLE